ncbi:MAG: folate/biopterin family MFS transporter [Candidatus Rokubacteria bacterium]|nr:folate/biopterin family MFS transporter [Candidatus Rokubacteria bacterium]
MPRLFSPFRSPAARRLAVLFAVVYFSQGMYYVIVQPLNLTLKERLGLTATQVATFGTITLIPWVIKPVYGLLSDAVPLFRRRRKSYFIIMSSLASVAGLTLAADPTPTYWTLAVFVTLMALGVAFTDVLTDAMMVENGKPLGLTGAFQSIQWAAINASSIIVGLAGGYFAQQRYPQGAFLVAAIFPLVALLMMTFFVHEAPSKSRREELHAAWTGIRRAVTDRTMWVVAGFIFFWAFSPSIGIPLFYYQTDTLKFSQQFIGMLSSSAAAAMIVGSLGYAPLSRRYSLQRIIVVSIGVATVGTLAYLLYNDWKSALIIDVTFGGVSMIIQLAFLDLAAKACPENAEGTFFALLMSVYNLGVQGSQITGSFLYDKIGYTPLVLISAAMTAAAWLLVPLVNIPAIEGRARLAGPPPEAVPAAH